jgi:nascent polypeptide-associated complex subunit alpha
MARIDSRRAKRMMKQMGMNMEEIPDMERVILQGKDREIVVEAPAVAVITMSGQKVFQVTGGRVTERALKKEVKTPEVAEEDVQLVAQQAGVSPERARTALKEAEGDLAKAILILTAAKK